MSFSFKCVGISKKRLKRDTADVGVFETAVNILEVKKKKKKKKEKRTFGN